MTWWLVILLFGPAAEAPHTRLVREFATEAQCQAEEQHYRAQAVEVGGGRVLLECELRVKG